MQSVGKAIKDAQLGQNRPFVEGMTDVFNTWQQKYPELVDGENDAAFLSQGYKLYYDTFNDLDSVRQQAAQTLTTLEKFTKGESDPEALQTLSNTLIGASPEERQKIYKYVTLAAEAGHIDRAGLDQFALNMGQSFTRGFDFVPQGSLQMQEAGVNNWLESIRNGTLRGWLDATEKALPGTFQNLVRDSEGDIVESLSQVQAAYENGKINADEETKLPPSFIGYIKNMMRTFAEVMRRAVALRGAFKDGALPAEYESFLADSVGLNQQARVDTASQRVAGDVLADTDGKVVFSRAQAQSNAGEIRASNATITGPANYSIGKSDDQRFADLVEGIASGQGDRTKAIPAGGTPNALILGGADPLPLTMRVSVVEKATVGKHSLPLDAVKSVPSLLRDPIFIFQSTQIADALTVILDRKHNGSSIMAAVHLNQREQRHEINRIASIYDKQSLNVILGWIRSGLLRFVNTEKAKQWSQSFGLQLPKEATTALGKKVKTEADLVKANYSIASQSGASPIVAKKAGLQSDLRANRGHAMADQGSGT